MAKDDDGDKAARKLSKRQLEKAIKLVDQLIDEGEHPGFAAKDFLNPTWQDRWYMECELLSESVESKSLQNHLKTRPEDTASSPSSHPSTLLAMLLTLNEVKDFLKDSLEDLENQEAAEKTKAEATEKAREEATEKARDEVSRRGWDDLSRSVRDIGPRKETIPRSVPVRVVAKGKPGIRQDRSGHTAIWVYNNLMGDNSPSISGTCTFWFKEIDKDEPEGAPEKVNRDDAVIPINSILVFEPTDQKRCVSEFRLQLLIKKNGTDERVPEVGYNDPGCGKCLTKFVFHCIDDNSGPLDWDPS